MAALALVPKPPATLYELEEHLATLVDCVDTVTPEQEAAFLDDFGRALASAVEKRDRVAQFMSHLESQIDLAKREIGRLSERKASFEASFERLKVYVVRTIEAQGMKKLEGSTVTLALRKCPASVELVDETVVPLDYKTVTLKISARLLDQLLDAVDFDLAGQVLASARDKDVVVDKATVKAALTAGTDVPGARWAAEKNTLVRR